MKALQGTGLGETVRLAEGAGLQTRRLMSYSVSAFHHRFSDRDVASTQWEYRERKYD